MNGATTYTAILLMLFAAAAGFLNASRNRVPLGFVNSTIVARRLLQGLSCLVLFMTLIAVVNKEGAEIGIPIWLGLVCVTVAAMLFCAALSPRRTAAFAALAFVCALLVLSFAGAPFLAVGG